MGGTEALEQPYLEVPLHKLYKKKNYLAIDFICRRNINNSCDVKFPGNT